MSKALSQKVRAESTICKLTSVNLLACNVQEETKIFEYTMKGNANQFGSSMMIVHDQRYRVWMSQGVSPVIEARRDFLEICISRVVGL
jgi:hypothetical protein